MAAQTVTYESLCASLEKGNYQPIYLLHGEQGYFTDALINRFEQILTPEEKDFNQYTLYAPQINMQEAIDACRRFPMMSDRQVVILKECQNARADQLEKLVKYVQSPSPQTILVIAFRGAQAKGKTLLAALRKNGAVIFESKKIYEDHLAPYITNYLKNHGLGIQPKAAEMLKDSIGTDLSRLFNELDKLIGILGKGATVTPEAVEQHIGVSKDYNIFELVDALIAKDGARAMLIAKYLHANSHVDNVLKLIYNLFSLFANVLIAHTAKDKTDMALTRAMGFSSSWQLKRVREACRNYDAWQAIDIIREIRRFDAQFKGIGSRRNAFDILEELIFRIITTDGGRPKKR